MALDEYTIDPRMNKPAPAKAPASSTSGGLSREAIDMIAAKEGVDADLVWSIYSQESGRGANARTSVDDARGGMQVLPGTYREVMGTDDGIDDPVRNTIAGVRYLAKIQKKVGADPKLLAAGYFSGPGNVSPDGIIDPGRRDGNGKDTASYAADVVGRLKKTEKKPAAAVAGNPAAEKPRPWSDIRDDAAFRALSPERRAEVRDAYAEQVLAPEVPTDQLEGALQKFRTETERDVAGPGLGERAVAAAKPVVQAIGRGLQALDRIPMPGQLPGSAEARGALADAAGLRIAPPPGVAPGGSVLDQPYAGARGPVTDAELAENTRQSAAGPGNAQAAADRYRTQLRQIPGAAQPSPTLGAGVDALGRAIEPAADRGGVADMARTFLGDAVRGTARGWAQFGGAGAGLVEAAGDATGSDAVQDFGAAMGRAQKTFDHVAGGKGGDSIVQQAFASTINNIALLPFGELTIPLMGVQQGAQSYSEARAAGKSPLEALDRGVWQGVAEAVGEKFSVPGLQALARNVGRYTSKEFAHKFSEIAVKEQVGEQITTAMQDAYDKAGVGGLKPNMTLEEYLEDAVNTAKVTLMQSAIMGGGGAALNKIAAPRVAPPPLVLDRFGDVAVKTPEQQEIERKWGAQPTRTRLAQPGLTQRAAAAALDKRAADLAEIPTDANAVLDGAPPKDAPEAARVQHKGSLYRAAQELIKERGAVDEASIIHRTGTTPELAREVMLALRERGELPEPKDLIGLGPFPGAATIQDQGAPYRKDGGKTTALVDTAQGEPTGTIRVDSAGTAKPETKAEAAATERAVKVNLAAQARRVNDGLTPDVQSAQVARTLRDKGALPRGDIRPSTARSETQPLLSVADGTKQNDDVSRETSSKGLDVPSYGTPREGAITVRGIHYSTQPRTSLSGDRFGTGYRGAERGRLLDARDRRLRSRVYFYVDEGRGVKPEEGVGSVPHQVELRNIYDPATKLVPSGSDNNQFESNVIDAGFDGYYARGAYAGQGGVVVLNPKDAIPVVGATRAARAAAAAKAAPESVKIPLLSKEIRALENAPGSVTAASPDAVLRAGTVTVPGAQEAAFRKSLAAAMKNAGEAIKAAARINDVPIKADDGRSGGQAAGAFIIARDTGRVLLQKRGKGDASGTHGLFGGGMDGAETQKQAVRREIREETGHDLGATPIVHLHSHTDDTGFTYHSHITYVPHEFEPKLNDETEAAVWSDPDKLPQPLHPGLAQMLAKRGPAAAFKAAHRAVRPKSDAILNIGLNVNDGSKITPDEVLESVRKHGGIVLSSAEHASDSEPTLVVSLAHPLTHDEANAVSAELRQDAIAQKTAEGGDLFGPKAEDWSPFNPEFFLMPDGSRANAAQPMLSIGDFHRDLGNRIKAKREYAELLSRQHEWAYNVGDTFLSTKTGKTYRIIGRTFTATGEKISSGKLVPTYFYESGNPPPRNATPEQEAAHTSDWERGTFREDRLLESKTMKNLTTPRPLLSIAGKLPDIGGEKSRALARIAKNLTPEERAKLRRDTAARLVDAVRELPSADEMAAVAFAGRAKRGWYAGSARAIGAVFGVDGPRFTALLAAMSPQTSVESNLVNALNTWKNWVAAGRPTGRGEILRIMGRSVEGSRGVDSVLGAWVPNSVRALTTDDAANLKLSGPKVNSFMRNLLGDVQEVTNDAWMANFALVNQKMFAGALSQTDSGKGPGYLAMSAQVRAAATRLTKLTGETWTPAEVQETIWSWAKTLYEMQKDGVTATDILYNEEMTDAMISSTPDFRSLFNDDRNANIIRAAGLGDRLSGLDNAAAGDQEPAPRSEASPFDPATQAAHEARAARRLEQLKARGQAALSVDGGVGEGAPAQSAEVSPAARAAVEALEESLRRSIPGLVLEPVAASTERRAGVSDFAARVLDKEVVFVHQSERLFNGAVMPGHSGVIIISDQATKPEMAVLGHELLHQLRRERPDLYSALRESIRGQLRNDAAYRAEINGKREDAGLEPIDADTLTEELIADIVGDRFTEPEFWDAMNMGSASLTRRVLEAVRNFLDNILAHIKVLRPFGTDKYLTDVRAARRAVARALGEYIEGSQEERAAQDTEAALSMAAPTAPFYSELARQVGNSKQGRATAEQWSATIRAMPGVKPEEIEWTGVDEWLKLQTGKVTREQISEYLAANGVQVRDSFFGRGFEEASAAVARHDNLGFDSASEALRDLRSQALNTNVPEAMNQYDIPAGPDRQVIAEYLAAVNNDGKATQYEAYRTPGGSNYREMLLQLPATPVDTAGWTAKPGEGDPASGPVWEVRDANKKWVLGVPRGNIPSAEAAIAHAAKSQRKSPLNFVSDHWADAPNVLAHIRFDERTDADGKRVLFIQELQSDWNAAGRKQGFQGDTIPQNTNWEQVDDTGNRYPTQQKAEEQARLEQVPWSAEIETRFVARQFGSEWGVVEQSRSRVDAAPQKGGVPRAPFVGNTSSWVALALKRTIKHAIDSGFDRVAIVSGQQATDVFSLEKQVESISWRPEDNPYGASQQTEVTIDVKGSNDEITLGVKDGKITEGPADLVGKDLEDAVGKDMAKRILESPDGDLRGLDLRMGGEGMKAFYDGVVPRVANDLLKKLGGGKVTTISIESPVPHQNRRADRLRMKTDTQLGFDLTPEMKDRSAGGMPLFSLDPNVTGVRAATDRRLRSLPQRIVDRVDQAMSPVGSLPDLPTYMKDRYETMGRMGRADKLANTVRTAMRRGDKAAQDQAYTFLTTPGALPNIITDPEVRAAAVNTKALLGSIGDQLVERGLLSPDVREEYRDRYLPRLYLKHQLGDSGGGMSGGKKVSDQGYLKKRRDIPEEVRRVLLGEITDAPFLAAVGISKPMRDMALIDFLERVAAHEEWILPHAVTDWSGQRVTPQWLQAEAKWLRQRADYPTEADGLQARFVADQMEQAAATALRDFSEPDTSKFRRVPDSARYGRLRGLWVRKEIHDDLVGIYAMRPEDMTVAESVLGFGGLGTRIQQIFKVTKVTLNPPSQVRNIVSNAVMLQLSGVPLAKVPYRLAQAVNDVRSDGRFTKMARQYGLTEATFAGVELPEARTEMLKVLLQGDSDIHPVRKIGLFAHWLGSATVEKAGDAYQYFETLFKVAKLIDGVASGQEPWEAALEAHKWLYDYTLVPNEVRYLRNAPIGAPFATWAYKTMPRLLEVAVAHPQRLLPWIGMWYGLPYMWALMGAGDDPEDVEKVKRVLPEWMTKKSAVAALPVRDSNGRFQVIDVGPYLPWTMYGDVLQGARNGSVVDAVKPVASMFFGGPIIDTISMLKTGVDPFTQKPVADKGDPLAYQFWSWANYAYNTAAPPFLTSQGVISPFALVDPSMGGKLAQAATGATDKFGNERATYGQALGRLFGANVYPVDPALAKATNLTTMVREVADARQSLVRKMQDQSLSEEQRAKLVTDFAREMKQRADKATEYAGREVPEATRPRK